MTGVIEDLRYGLRSLAKHRGFALVAVFSLALGIGANTTIFTLINAILFRPLAVTDPASLTALYTVDPRSPGFWPCSYPNYKDYRDRNQVFSSLALYAPVEMNLASGNSPQRIWGQIVSGNYFNTLGVTPVVGRGFLEEEDQTPGANPVAVISYGLWTRNFGGDANVTSRSLNLNGRLFRIVGVAPRAFHGLTELLVSDIWVPMAMYETVYPSVSWVNQRRALLFFAVGRLKPGVGLPQAATALQLVSQDLERQYPKDNHGRRLLLMPAAEAALAPQVRPIITRTTGILAAVSGLVLLIACCNVANLLLARGVGRTKEITVRLALGASRYRLIRQLLTENVVLALTGGAAGLLLARWARDILWSLRPPIFAYAFTELELDGRVLAYTLAISILTGVLFGLLPALRSTRSNLASDLKERAGQPGAAAGGWQPRALLVMGQVAFSVIALIGAGLFLRSLQNANRIDPGFDAAHLGVISFNLADQGYSEARGREFQQRTLERAAGVPGVAASALSKDQPFTVSGARTVLLEGQDQNGSGQGRITLTSVVFPGYFRTAGIPLLRGRDFSKLDDKASPHVAIVNEVAAALFWPGEDAVGKRIRFFGESLPVEVVGLARTAKYQELGETPQALIYLSLQQYYFPTNTLYVRSEGNLQATLAAVHHEIQSMDRNLLLLSETLDTTIQDTLWVQRLSAALLTVFGALALLLATIGIYGVISYSVNQRVREIGVRMALGATPGDVQMMVVREGVRLVSIGVLVGTSVSLGSSRLVQSMLLVTSSRDALTFILVPAILSLVAIVACWLPARRATRIEPLTALRDE
jgi:predicted permease